MPAKFGVHFTDFTTSTAAKTMVRLAPAAQKFVEIIELIVTGSGITAAADTQHEGGIFPLTTGGAGTAASSPTPEKFQQTSAASGVTVGHSVLHGAHHLRGGGAGLLRLQPAGRLALGGAERRGRAGPTRATPTPSWGAKVLSAAAGKVSAAG